MAFLSSLLKSSIFGDGDDKAGVEVSAEEAFRSAIYSVLKNNLEKTNRPSEVKDGEFEPSSVCLAKIVQNSKKTNASFLSTSIRQSSTMTTSFSSNLFWVCEDERRH
ncbi:unnamed protein product [Lactuca virosa]|uniref:Uncharacterized protein n=1 Tax=Lactuca virosa TaxID=75947 RepID=A0AAU9NC41_9ASTR|nr:unnamed protein product [Lactuca virosa]